MTFRAERGRRLSDGRKGNMITDKMKAAAAAALLALVLAACSGSQPQPGPQEAAAAETAPGEAMTQAPAEEAAEETAPAEEAAEAATEEAAAAVTAGEAEPAAEREMTEEEKAALEAFLNRPENRGFLSCFYEEPEEIDFETALAGLGGGEAEPDAKETELYLAAADRPFLTGTLLRRTGEEMEAFLHERAGIGLDRAGESLGWVHAEKTGCWYRESVPEPDPVPVVIEEGRVRGPEWTIRFRARTEVQEADGYLDPLYEAVLFGDLEGEKLQFGSCRDITEAPFLTRKVWIGGRPGTLSFYMPPEEFLGGAPDVTILYETEDGIRAFLDGSHLYNIRNEGARFSGVSALDVRDMTGDGLDDLVLLLDYAKKMESGEERTFTDLRIYRASSSGLPLIDPDTAMGLEEKVPDRIHLTLEDVYAAAAERTPPVLEGYESWQEAYLAFLEARGDEDLAGYWMADIDGNGTPELAAIGARPALGSQILTFQGGNIVRLFTGASFFSCLEGEGLICDSYEAGGTRKDIIYTMHSGSFEAASSGSCVFAEDGTVYTWDGARMTREGYRDAREFIFASERAVSPAPEDLMDAAAAMAEIQKD